MFSNPPPSSRPAFNLGGNGGLGLGGGNGGNEFGLGGGNNNNNDFGLGGNNGGGLADLGGGNSGGSGLNFPGLNEQNSNNNFQLPNLDGNNNQNNDLAGLGNLGGNGNSNDFGLGGGNSNNDFTVAASDVKPVKVKDIKKKAIAEKVSKLSKSTKVRRSLNEQPHEKLLKDDPRSAFAILNLDPKFTNPNQGVYTYYPAYRSGGAHQIDFK